jgi:hypothetical protein
VAHVKVHLLLAPHAQLPFEQVPVQVVLSSQMTWHGGAMQLKLQLLPRPHVQVPFAQTALQELFSPAHKA